MFRYLIALSMLACTRTSDGRTDAVSTARPDSSPASPAPASHDPAGDSLLRRADAGRIMGSPTAKVWMVVVSDFQCPYCRDFDLNVAPTIRQQYVKTGRVRIAYLNFPLNQHQHAWPAAEVAMCAAAQDRFWPVHDAIFASQPRWSGLTREQGARFFDSLAVASGVAAEPLRACVSSGALKPLIQADYDRSRRAGAQSTPTVIIDAKVIPGVAPLEIYRATLDSALVHAARNGG